MNTTHNTTHNTTINTTMDSTPMLILGFIFLSFSVLAICAICCSACYHRNKNCCDKSINTNYIDSDEEEHYSSGAVISQSIGIYISESEDESETIEYINTISNKNSEPKFCSICQENICNTVKTDCNHHFCQECIEENIKISRNCPLCKHEIKNITFYI